MEPVLYISYDGLLDPLGASQVRPYLRELARRGVRLTVLSFEKPERLADCPEVARVRRELAAEGIRWRPLRYHKRPASLATAWDVLAGIVAGLALGRGAGLIHARSYIAALIALALCRLTGARLLFDMRGFWADERVEGGLWRPGARMYRLFKALERRYLARADGIVVLTRRGAEILRGMLPPRESPPLLRVIPTCADLELFRPPSGGRPPVAERPLRLIYHGSFGTWYLLPAMLAFYEQVRRVRPGSIFSLVTPAPAEEVWRAAAGLGLAAEARDGLRVESRPYREVPAALAQADCAVFFIRPSFSKQASCATKFGEALACGLPVVTGAGIGDHDRQVREQRVGLVLEDFSEGSLARAARELPVLLADPELPGRCRALAEAEFSLAGGAERYLELYRELLGEPAGIAIGRARA